MAETEVDVAAHRDSYPMGNIHHGTEERPDWGTFCVECKQSWPCDVSILAERLRVAEGERDAAQLALGEQADIEREAFGRGVTWAIGDDAGGTR